MRICADTAIARFQTYTQIHNNIMTYNNNIYGIQKSIRKNSFIFIFFLRDYRVSAVTGV